MHANSRNLAHTTRARAFGPFSPLPARTQFMALHVTMSPGLQLRHQQHAQSGRFQWQATQQIEFYKTSSAQLINKWSVRRAMGKLHPPDAYLQMTYKLLVCNKTNQCMPMVNLSNPPFYVIVMANFRSCFYLSWPLLKVGTHLVWKSFLNLEPTLQNMKQYKLLKLLLHVPMTLTNIVHIFRW